jgi:glycosyltransferase involved in cell wall biosynthesis
MEMTTLLQKLRTISVFSRHHNDLENVFISINASDKGGGSNTFSYNFRKWLHKNKKKYNLVYDIAKADRAIVIADKIDMRQLERAKARGCFVIHRLDEHVEHGEDEYRRKKHAYIRKLNRLADVTVYQSNFVFENMHPFLGKPENYEIIHNGANPEEFYPAEKPGVYIGHITWGVGDKKRLDILYDTIKNNPDEKFLLVGNHNKSPYSFDALSNVEYAGSVSRNRMLSLLHRMKFLFFPSENDPCPNTVIEAILAGVPVCYNSRGGTKELVKDCGLPIPEFHSMKQRYPLYRHKCLLRKDLGFDSVALRYLSLQ